MNVKISSRRGFVLSVFAFAHLVGTSATSQESVKPEVEKWRPKDGVYARSGKDFIERCGNFGDFVVELGKKTITGDEWICDVIKIMDDRPGAIRLDLNCSDVNLEAQIPKPNPGSEEIRFEEFMTLRKSSDNSLLMRKTENGKYKWLEFRAEYCPAKAQRAYIESKRN